MVDSDRKTCKRGNRLGERIMYTPVIPPETNLGYRTLLQPKVQCEENERNEQL